jgi:energy-coupling factor transport system permease protein
MAFSLLVTAIRRATTLATVMEVRGFGAESASHRTWARPSRLTWADAVGLGVTLSVVAASLLAAIWAGTFWLIWLGVPG